MYVLRPLPSHMGLTGKATAHRVPQQGGARRGEGDEGGAPTAIATCEGCQGRFPAADGPTHAYFAASPGCWARFQRALDLQFSDERYWPAHHLLTDAYALQHSLGHDPRAIRSVHVHLGALYARIELGQPESRVRTLRRSLAQFDFHALDAPWPAPSVSINDVDLSDPERHLRTVDLFARAVLSDWSAHHGLGQRLCAI